MQSKIEELYGRNLSRDLCDRIGNDKSTLDIGYGEVAEWTKAPDSKSGVRATVPGVRIPSFRKASELNPIKSNTYSETPRACPHFRPHTCICVAVVQGDEFAFA